MAVLKRQPKRREEFRQDPLLSRYDKNRKLGETSRDTDFTTAHESEAVLLRTSETPQESGTTRDEDPEDNTNE